jgi:hypothetical protein
MGANNPAQRPVRRPPSDLAALELPQTRQIARTWFRVHPAIYPAIRFSLLARHRFSHPDCPNKLLYLAMDAETCFWECFGDDMFDNGRVLAKTHWDDSSISKVMVPPLHLCDLSNTSTRSAITVDLTALMSADLAIPQEWGLAIQKHPARVRAIKFKSRFTGMPGDFRQGSFARATRRAMPGPAQSIWAGTLVAGKEQRIPTLKQAGTVARKSYPRWRTPG